MRIIDSTRGRGDDSTRLMSWKYAKTSGVGGSGVSYTYVLEFYINVTYIHTYV